MSSSNWSDGRIEHLKTLWQDGLSASQVASALGDVTRNAVLGKLHRLGLLASTAGTRPARPRASTVRHRASCPPKISLLVPVAEPDPFTFDDGSFATVVTVGDRMCRWPIGDPKGKDFHFCGQDPKTGSCYCEAHTQRAHQPGPARRHRKPVHATAAGW